MDNILITGAASGIGAATARLFHARGWKVGLLDINHAALASLAAELGGVWHAELDVADAAAVQAALKDFAGGARRGSCGCCLTAPECCASAISRVSSWPSTRVSCKSMCWVCCK